MTEKVYNVLFICTGNSARSIIAETLMNHLGRGRFKAYSAGSHPRGDVHPLTLEILSKQGYDIAGLRSQSWTEFSVPDAPKMDFIFTVCDQAAGESCPVWPGQPITAHWGFEDPARPQADLEHQMRVFQVVATQIANRIRLFLSLPIDKVDRMSLQTKLQEMGREDSGGAVFAS